MPFRESLRAISFDAMGTLFSLRERVGSTYARAAARHGIVIPAETMETAFRAAWKELPAPLHPEGQTPPDDDRSWWRRLVHRSFTLAGTKPEDARVCDAIFDELYAHFAGADAWTLPADTMPALDALSQRYRLIVLSNFDRRLHSILAGLGIGRYFERIIVSSEVGANKPHPRMFAAALTVLGLPASQCLHVGDDERADREGAAKAGIGCFLIDRPRTTLRSLTENLDPA